MSTVIRDGQMWKMSVFGVVLVSAFVACGAAKDTGLPAGPTEEPPPSTLVKVVDVAFEPPRLEVKPGEEIVWEWGGAAPHDVRFATVDIRSHPECTINGTGCSAQGDPPFRTKIDTPGEYIYYCTVHGTPEGYAEPQPRNMAGKIVVTAASA